jgi:hypothetical protein
MDAFWFLKAPPSEDGRRVSSNHAGLGIKPLGVSWWFAMAKLLAGAALFWFAASNPFPAAQIARGWLGMIGIVMMLHFGLFELLALVWSGAGIKVQPVMQTPLTAASLSELWSRRWNTAFNTLAHELAFRPLARRLGTSAATIGVFLFSGLVHEAVISVPARGGYGLPTAYFLLQGLGVLTERSPWGRRFRLGRGVRGWLFVIVFAGGPAFWLFHPVFIHNIILPMLRALGAT